MKVKTEEFLKKENNMYNRCTNKVVEGYIEGDTLENVFNSIVEEMNEFYENNNLADRVQCNKCMMLMGLLI